MSVAEKKMPALQWGQDYQPSVTQLQLHIFQAVNLLQSVDPYIICIYDHSEAFLERERAMISMKTTAQDGQEKEQPASLDHSRSYRWDAFQLLYRLCIVILER